MTRPPVLSPRSATFNLKAQFDRDASPIISTVGQIGSGSAAAEPATPGQGGQGQGGQGQGQGQGQHDFGKLLVVREGYLLSWSSDSVVIIDPAKGRLLGWYSDIKGKLTV